MGTRPLRPRGRKWTSTVGGLLAIVLIVQTAILVEACSRARLDPNGAAVSTNVYARPIVLTRGTIVDRERVEAHLRRLGYRRARARRVDIGEYRFSTRRWIIGRRAFRHRERLEPSRVVTVRLGSWSRITGLQDHRGRLSSVVLEPELLGVIGGATPQERVAVVLGDVPRHLIDAVLSIEDRRFFDHGGLDVRRVVGAGLANVRAGRIVQGGSTISQQLAKNLYLSARRSPIRKVRELAMAVVLERRYDKTEILEAYLNEVYFGHHAGRAIHGVGRAAQHFFGKDVSELDLRESALLAGLIRGPNFYSPFRHPDRARDRRDLVLDVMRERQLVSEREHDRARTARLGVRPPPEITRVARHYLDYLVNDLTRRYGGEWLDRGLTVFSTVDMELQSRAERAVREGLARLEADNPYLVRAETPLQAALVAIDPYRGELLAMVGGRDYGTSQFNRAVHASRQPGSAFKPIVALAAVTESGRHTLASLLPDEPLSLTTPAGLWQPANYDGQFRGMVTLREALERSLNVPFARLGLDVGPQRIVDTAERMGVVSALHAVPSLALGSSEVTPLELTRAFGVLAAAGFRAELRTTLGMLDHRGRVVQEGAARGSQVFDPAAVYLITSALQGAVERGTGRRLRGLGLYGPVAAKSGTTNAFRDAWFVGYTPAMAVGVWVGYDDGRTIGLPGSRAALPIFAQFVKDAADRDGRRAAFSRPPGTEIVEIDAASGLRAGYGCRGTREVFVRGTAPQASCSRFPSVARRDGRWRIDAFQGDDRRRSIDRRRRRGRNGN